jgi:hypothetical protein
MITLQLPLRRCAQCWRYKSLEAFVGAKGSLVRACAGCRERYAGWDSMTLQQKLASRSPRSDPKLAGRVIWAERSGNAKLGPIPASISERGTCPPSCGLYEAGCYAEYGMLGSHWRAVGKRGLDWHDFLDRIRDLPEGQLWRHNVAGDLAGRGETVDNDKLAELIEANAGRRGFTFSHKQVQPQTVLAAARQGFVINLSADTLQDADRRAVDGAPVAVVLAHDAPGRLRTPAGRYVVMCVAETTPGVTCAQCQLCAKADRSSIVGFRAHGQYAKQVPQLVTLRRKPTIANESLELPIPAATA